MDELIQTFFLTQVASQLSNLPDRSDSQLDKLLSTAINCLLLAQGQSDVETRLQAEEILVSVVKSVPGTSLNFPLFTRPLMFETFTS